MWISVEKERVPEDIPCKLKNINGDIKIGCSHVSKYATGIIELSERGGNYFWDSEKFLLKITHWMKINQ